MKDLLHKLHQKPEHHRKSMALGASLIVTLMIFGIWMSTLSGRVNEIGTVAKDTQKQFQESITPLATVKSSFDEAFGSINEFKAEIQQAQEYSE